MNIHSYYNVACSATLFIFSLIGLGCFLFQSSDRVALPEVALSRRMSFHIVIQSFICLSLLNCMASNPPPANPGGDASYYIEMAKQGLLSVHMSPFNYRLLTPLIAKSISAMSGMELLESFRVLNFLALNFTAHILSVIVVNMGVNVFLSLLVPVYFIHSYVGKYAFSNPYLTDPIAFLLYAAISLELLKNGRWFINWKIPVFLTLLALNSEKVVYWTLPFFYLITIEYLRDLKSKKTHTMRDILPKTIELLRKRYFTKKNVFYWLLWLLPLMTLGVIHSTIKSTHTASGFITDNILWQFPVAPAVMFPFGFLSVLSYLSVYFQIKSPDVMSHRVICFYFLYIPILASLLIATDIERMMQYSFIIVIITAFKFFKDISEHKSFRFVRFIFAFMLFFQLLNLNLFKPTISNYWNQFFSGRWFWAALLLGVILVKTIFISLPKTSVRTSFQQ